MTQDDIIRMAREASGGMLSYDSEGQWRLNEVEAQRFAALVAAAEREMCAQLIENYALQYAEPVWALKLTETIRARGEK